MIALLMLTLTVTGNAPIYRENGQPIGNYELAILLYDADTDEFVDARITWPGLAFKFWVPEGRYYAKAKIVETQSISKPSGVVQKESEGNVCGASCHE